MAKIIKTDTQEAALRIINNNLRVLAGVNRVLNSNEQQCGINITVENEKVFIMIEKSFGDEILQAIRKRMVKETKTLARKNAIALNQSDIETLENNYVALGSSGLETQNKNCLTSIE